MEKDKLREKNRPFTLWGRNLTRRGFRIAAAGSALVILVLTFLVIAYTPLRTLIPGYPNAASRRQAVQNALRIDSLQTRILQWELYTENLRRVIAGEDPIKLDSLVLGTQTRERITDSTILALGDSLLRADVREQEQFQLGGPTRTNLPMDALSFFPPLSGVVSRGFEPTLHSWVDVTAPAGSPVLAVLDGSVVWTTWEEGSGYTVLLQHDGGILSVYGNLEKLLRSRGDKVKAGTPLGVLASSPSLTRGDHLHLELWYDGVPVDPQTYISF